MIAIINNNILKRVTGNGNQFTVPESVTEIGQRTFENCTNLTQVNLPETVTVIGKAALLERSNLIQKNIPESVTKVEKLTFKEGSSLTQIEIPYTVNRLSDTTFFFCKQLRTIVINTDNETNRVSAFSPTDLKVKVTSFHYHHLKNMSSIKRAKLNTFCSYLSLFDNCSTNKHSPSIITPPLFKYLTLKVLQQCRITCKLARHIGTLHNAIQEIQFQYNVPLTLYNNAITINYFSKAIALKMMQFISPYHRHLIKFERHIQEDYKVNTLLRYLKPHQTKLQQHNNNYLLKIPL